MPRRDGTGPAGKGPGGGLESDEEWEEVPAWAPVEIVSVLNAAIKAPFPGSALQYHKCSKCGTTMVRE